MNKGDKIVSAICTLPISPRENAELGFYNIPFLAHLIGKATNLKTVIPINNLGSKVTDSGFRQYIDFLNLINARPDIFWVDSDLENLSIVNEVIWQGLGEGWITKENKKLYICECGKTELQEESLKSNWTGLKRSVYKFNNNKIICSLCNTPALPVNKFCLLLHFPSENNFSTLRIIPEYAKVELDHLFNYFLGKYLLISRTKTGGSHIKVGGETFGIDVDFCWFIFMFVLWKRGIKIDTILIGHKTIRQTLFCLLLSNLLKTPQPMSIIAVPYRKIEFDDKINNDANELLKRFGVNVIRYFLAMGLGGRSKTLTLSSNFFYLIQHSIRIDRKQAEHSFYKHLNTRQLWELYNYNKFCNILANLRKNKYSSLSDEDKKILNIILI